MDITEEYVSIGTSKLLKEKGFDEDINLWYDESGEMFSRHKYDISSDWRVKAQQKVYSCPTLQMAMKWLRENHGIHIDVNVCKYGDDHKTMYEWTPVLVKEDHLEYPISHPDGSIFGGFENTYGQAAEAAIGYCLENLMEEDHSDLTYDELAELMEKDSEYD